MTRGLYKCYNSMVNEATVYKIDKEKYVVYYKNRLVMQTSYKRIALASAKAINNGETYVIPTGYQNH